MPAGTIALTNKSATVAGTGTSFTTELKAGDFVYINVGGAPYTLVAANITSDTQLTLAVAFDGPTTSGLAWNAAPASLQVAITQKILNDFASVARGRILDFQNWQKIYSDEQSVDVVRPDRTTFTGPSWGYMASQISSKVDKSALDAYAKKGANSDITSITGLTTALSVAQGGTGAKTKEDAFKNIAVFGAEPGTAAQGNDTRLTSINGKTGGTVSGDISATGSVKSTTTGYGFTKDKAGVASSKNLMMLGYLSDNQYSIYDISVDSNDVYTRLYTQNGSGGSMFYFGAGGTGQSKSGWTTYSDRRLKTEIEKINDALSKINKLNGYTYSKFGQRQTGVIAQEVQEILPEAVMSSGFDVTLDDGKVVKNALSLSPGDLVGLLVEGIKQLDSRIDDRDSAIAELSKRMKAIDGLDA